MAPAALDPDLSLASWSDAERLFGAVREHVVEVAQPLVLISQVQRSGGTLLNTLLDGHPALHSHPYELLIGHPTKHDWPVLDLDAGVDAWLETLRERFVAKLFAVGYRKSAGAETPALPFTIVPSLVERLFRVLCAERPPSSGREILNRYLTALFNAWLDCQGLREQPKAWVVGFGPRLAWGAGRTRFLADYPDGRIVVVHRDPRAWYASASRFAERYGAFDEALSLWERGAREALAARRDEPGRVYVLTYERLVTSPEETMRALTGWLGIEWHPLLLAPTFNRLPAAPNSSHGLTGPGVSTASLERWRELLSAEVVAQIEARTRELDASVRAAAELL